MLAQAALKKRKKMGLKSNDDEHVVVASGSLAPGEKPGEKKKKNATAQQHVQVIKIAKKVPPKPSIDIGDRKDNMPPPKKYGGFLPDLDDNDRPILAFLVPHIIKKADERSMRLIKTNNDLQVSLGCPFPCCAGVGNEPGAVGGGIDLSTVKLKKVDAKKQSRGIYEELALGKRAKQAATTKDKKKEEDETEKVPAGYTKAEVDKAWTEHKAPNGQKYYYNSISFVSTYKKPKAFVETKLEEAGRKKEWKEYMDRRSGKPYYSDGVTVTWEKPPDFKEEKKKASKSKIAGISISIS